MKKLGIYVKSLLLTLFFAILGVAGAYAQTEVNSKTIWVFGSDASQRTDPSSSYSGATTKYITSFDDVTNDGTVSLPTSDTNPASTFYGHALHYRKNVNIKLATAGKVTVLVKGAGQDELDKNGSISYASRTFRIKKTVNGSTTTNEYTVDGSSGPIAIHVDAGTTLSLVSFKEGSGEGQAWINYYYIVYEPNEKLDLDFNFNVNGGTNTLDAGTWTYPWTSLTGLQPQDAETFTINSGEIHYTSSDSTVATIDKRWNHIKAIKAGNVTFKAYFAGNDTYNGFTKTVNVIVNAAPQPHSLSTTTLKSNNNGSIGDLSVLQGNTMGINTASNVDATEWVKAYSGSNTDITTSGALTVTGIDNLTVTDGHMLKGNSVGTTATMRVTWLPPYAENVEVNDFTSVCGLDGNHGSNASASGSTITISSGDQGRISYNVTTTNQYNQDEYKEASGFKYFLIELENEIPSGTEVQILAEYGNLGSTWGVDGKSYTSGRFLYVPLRPNGMLSAINIGTASGTQTLNIKSVGFVNSLDLPAEASINNITVEDGSLRKFGMSAGVYPNPLTEGYQTWAYVLAQKGELTDAEWEYVQAHWDDIKSRVAYTSSDPNIATVTSWGWVEAKAPGATTITATFNSNDSFDGYQFAGPVTAQVTLNVVADEPSSLAAVKQPQLLTTSQTALTNLAGTTMGLTTVNQVDASDYIHTYYDGRDISSSGKLTITSNDESLIRVVSDTKLEGLTTTSAGSITSYWVPWDNNPAWIGGGGYTIDGESDNTITITASLPRTRNLSDAEKYSINNNITDKGLTPTYYYIELDEPTTTAMYLQANYADHVSNRQTIPAGSKFLYVPLYNANLNSVTIGVDSGEATVKIKTSQVASVEYLPASSRVDNITVEEGVKTQLTMEVAPNPVTMEYGTTQALTVTIKDAQGNVLTGTNKPAVTFTSAAVATATVSDAGVVTGVAKGDTKVTVAIADPRVYDVAPIEVDVTVTKKVLTMTIDPATKDMKVTDSPVEFTVTYKHGNTTIMNLSTDFEAGNQKNGNTVVRSFIYLVDGSNNDQQKITGVTNGKVKVRPNMEGTATVIATFNETEEYEAATVSAIVNVTSHANMVYMGPALEGNMHGTLKDPTDETTPLLNWKFGAPEKDDIWVFKHYTKNGADVYKFQADPLKLKAEQHDLSSSAADGANENPIDDYCLTRLTDNDGGGDAFTEYNGMMGGYGTENGGRYLTPISGTFIRVEPLYDGIVTIRLRHNGGVDFGSWNSGKSVIDVNNDKKRTDVRCGRRPLYVMDENGEIMQRTNADTWTYWWNKWEAAYTQSDGESEEQVKADKTAFKPFGTSSDDITNRLNGTFAIIDNNSHVNNRWDVVSDAYDTWLNNISDWTEDSNGSVQVNWGTEENPDLHTYKLGKNWDYNFSKNAYHYIKNVVYSDETDFNSKVRYYTKTDDKDSGQETTKTRYVQKLWYSAEQDDVAYQAKDGIKDLVDEKTYFFAKYGYECLAASHLKISFPVKAGKTYFVGANKSKVALCTIEFDVYQPNVPTTVYTLDDTNDSSTPTWLTNGTGAPADGDRINVKVKREFTPGYWHPIVLPFSVSETELRAKFGKDVQVIALDGSLTNLSSLNNYETRDRMTYDPDGTSHISWMDKPYAPTFLTDGGAVIGFSGHETNDSKFVIKKPAIRNSSVTFTKHYYQMLYANCPAFICPSEVNYDMEGTTEKTGEMTFSNVTFVKPTLNTNNEIVLPYVVDHEIGDHTGENGNHYYYRMVAKYQTTAKETIDNDMYYISNSGGDDNVATLYHASSGQNPAMKSMRVWIEPKAENYTTAPLRHIAIDKFDDGAYVDDDPSMSGINDVILESTEYLDQDDARLYDDNVYDIMGRIVGHGSLDGLAPGIYIHHGVKTCIH